MTESPDEAALHVLSVIVLYKVRACESIAFQSLQMAINFLQPGQVDIRVLLYDNSPEAQPPGELPPNTWYEASTRNDGVAGAYSRGLFLAQFHGYNWLLALDQDTVLPQDFLTRLFGTAFRLQAQDRVGTIVPQLTQSGRPLSPVCILPWGVKYLPRGFTGIARGETHAFNSGSLFRVSALKQIGGFSSYFWLDHLDAYVFRQLHMHGKQVYVAGDIQVGHDLSVMHLGEIGTDRFRNFLQAESAFSDLYRAKISGLAITGRLIARLLKQRMLGADPELRKLTWIQFKKRVLQSRRLRLEEWKSEMKRHLNTYTGDEMDTPERPLISVCMAAFNGEKYIIAQLQSILFQLRAEDEVIIVDDASTDGTVDKVLSLGDRRVRLIRHKKNCGVSRTFEDAIRAATNPIIFLSDQDDLWDRNKVTVILKAFRSHPDVTLIATDVALIDENDALLTESYFKPRGKFRPGFWANLVRNRFGGCTMAFRSEVIGDILPLPHKYDVLHDVWIGIRNSLSGHRTLYIPEPLVLNRRHSTTATGKKQLTLRRKMRIRIHLLLAQAEFWIGRLQ